MLRCVSITPLARPIAPEVKTMTATSPGSTGGNGSLPTSTGSPRSISVMEWTRPSRAPRSMSTKVRRLRTDGASDMMVSRKVSENTTALASEAWRIVTISFSLRLLSIGTTTMLAVVTAR